MGIISPVQPALTVRAQLAVPSQQYALQQLGQFAQLDSQTGLLRMNTALIEHLVTYREAIVPGLTQLLRTSNNRLQIVEALYLGQRLAEEKVSTVKQLYAAASGLNTTRDPLIQIYLAGFYRKLNTPETFGPLVQMLLGPKSHPYAAEEVGGALLQQVANHTVDELWRRQVAAQNTFRQSAF